VSTCDASYYKWTQWIFLQLFKRGLAYQAEVPVNWCPALGTGGPPRLCLLGAGAGSGGEAAKVTMV
jgi:hypothetical protein